MKPQDRRLALALPIAHFNYEWVHISYPPNIENLGTIALKSRQQTNDFFQASESLAVS
jgi:hypothetical protein